VGGCLWEKLLQERRACLESGPLRRGTLSVGFVTGVFLFSTTQPGDEWSVLQFENNYFTEMCSGSEAGSYLRLIDSVHHSTLGLRVIKK